MNADQLNSLWLLGLKIVSGAIGWFLRTLWEANQEMRKDLKTLELKVAGEYAPNTRIDDITKAIFDRFDRLEDKFDRCFIRNHGLPPAGN